MRVEKKIIDYISIIGLIFSLIGIYIFSTESEIEIKSKDLFLGVFGAGVGVLLSFIFLLIMRRKPYSTVFLAYSYNDKELAEKVSKEMINHKINTLMENDNLEIGTNIINQLEETIEKADIVIVFLSKDFHKSKNLKNVIILSKKLKKKILPISLDNSEIPNSVVNLKYFDTTKDFDKTTQEVIEEVLNSK